MPRSFSYSPRAQLCASIRLLCPKCGHIATYRLDYTQHELRCKRCRLRCMVGLVLHFGANGSPGKPAPPLDTVFPVIGIDHWPWHSGERIHKVTYDD